MNVNDYLRTVLVQSNSAVSALRRAGMPVDLERLEATATVWDVRMHELERYVEGEAAKHGVVLR